MRKGFDMRPNEHGAGKRGIRALLHTGRTCPALPDRERWPARL